MPLALIRGTRVRPLLWAGALCLSILQYEFLDAMVQINSLPKLVIVVPVRA